MNKENLRYSDVETTRELMRTLSWQGEKEAYEALRKFLKDAEQFATENLTFEEKKLLETVNSTLMEKNKIVLVSVDGLWYEARFCMGQVVVLQRAHSIPDYKVFVWEIENYKEIELTN